MEEGTVKLAKLFVGVAAPVAITFLCYRFLKVNAATVAMFYLLAVLLIAASWGLLESTVASVAAVLCFNFFFLPPVLTFTIADPQNWFALFAFLATAIIGSQLSSYARKQTQAAYASKQETEQLYSLSRTILLLDEHANAAGQIARNVTQLFGFKSAIIFDRLSGQFYSGGKEPSVQLSADLKEAAGKGTVLKDEANQRVVVPIQLGAEPIGSIAIEGALLSDGARQALLNLIAIALERERQREETMRVRVERKSERLKSTLLDAIAHEFKTPLTSIKAAAGSLLSPSVLPHAEKSFEPARELVCVIDQEADRLNALVRDTIQTARIDAGVLQPRKRECHIDELFSRAIRELDPRRDGRSFQVDLSPELPPVSADPDLIGLTLRLLLDNAIKYSPPASSIAISGSRQQEQLMIHVHNEGAGIAPEEQERLFEKFYRSPANENHVPGAGMGLSVAREIMRAHGGEIQVRSEPNRGVTFTLLLPAGKPTQERNDAAHTGC
jgi:two-component system sensor histidine kinase KdpD